MRLGIFISIGIVLLLGLIILVMSSSSPDGPTRRTRPERLGAASLSNLPAMFTATEPGADAGRRYEAALQYYLSHQTSLQRDPKDAQTAELTELLVSAMEAAQVPKGLLDDFVSLKPGETPSFDDALEAIPSAVLARAEKLREQGKHDAALVAARSVWALGQRLFQNSVLLFNRRNGLVMMMSAGETLFHLADRIDGGAEAIKAWSAELTKINDQWQEKIEVVAVVRPHIGDLLQLARYDQDLTFRVEATKQMAIAKFNPGHRGNQKAIEAYLAEAQDSPDKLVVDAAKVAQAFTVEELRRMK
jgi:hypothetical protein